MVARSLFVGLFATNAAVDVVALLVNGRQYAARIAVELVLRFGVANMFDGVSGNGLQVDVRIRAHLAHDNHLSCGNESFDGAMRFVVVGQELVYQSIRYLVGHLVGMPFGNRLGRKKICHNATNLCIYK